MSEPAPYFVLLNVVEWAARHGLEDLSLSGSVSGEYPLEIILVRRLGYGPVVVACAAASVGLHRAQMPEDAPWPAGAVGDAEILSVVRVKTPTYDDVAALCHLSNFDAVARPARRKGAHFRYATAVDTLRGVAKQWRDGQAVWISVDFESVNARADGASDFGFERVTRRNGLNEARDRGMWVDESVVWPAVATRSWQKHRRDYAYGPTLVMSPSVFEAKLRGMVEDVKASGLVLFLVAHGANNERMWLGPKIGVDIPEAGLTGEPGAVNLVDTQLLDAAFRLPFDVAEAGIQFTNRSLEVTSRDYVHDLADVRFHNAGNDAYCTMRLFEGMMERALRLHVDA